MWPLKNRPHPAAQKRGVRQAQSLKRRRQISLILRGSGLTLVCCSILFPLYVWKSELGERWLLEGHYQLEQQASNAGFAVREVRIIGQNKTRLDQLRQALNIYDEQSLIGLDLPAMLTRVEALPWIKDATLVRQMPDRLDVHIREHVPAALWQKAQHLYLITRAGTIITDEDITDYRHLPHVVGAEANENLSSLLAMKQAYPALFKQIKSAVWVGDRRWDLYSQGGIIIKMPEQDTDLAWQALSAYENQQKLLARDILIIDLRQPGKTIIRLTPSEADRRREQEKNRTKEEHI